MEQPRYFLNVCDSVLSWIDEGKLPEQNAAGLKDGKLGGGFKHFFIFTPRGRVPF